MTRLNDLKACKRLWGTLGMWIILYLLIPPGQIRSAIPTEELETFIGRTMSASAIPGLAIAIVEGNNVLYAKGFGVTDVENGRPVTADTQFYLASTTKSFTALAAALLASRDLIDLDASLTQALPPAKLHPQISGDQITLRDLLCHTHGIMPGGPIDFRMAYTGDFTNRRLLDLLRFHGPAPTGNAFAYSNLGYNIFSMVLDNKFKEGWKQILQREIFEPLGMKNTTCWISKADPDRLAQPHELKADGMKRIYYAKRDENMQAGGGSLSTARDLTRYLLAHINGGRLDGRQMLPESAVMLSHRQQVKQDRIYGPYQRIGWALGWDIAIYDGDTILTRFGSFSGFYSHLSFMPERKIGVVLLTNGGSVSSRVAESVATYAYDLVLGKLTSDDKKDEEWTRFTTFLANWRKAYAKDLAMRRTRSQTTPLPLDAYVGTYECEAFGRMTWLIEKGQLRVRMGVAQGNVEVYNGVRHQFRIDIAGEGIVVTFEIPQGAQQPTNLRFMNQTFARVQQGSP